MKNVWMVFVALVMTMSLGAVGIVSAKSAVAAKLITGEVVRVDPSMNTLVIKVSGSDPGMNQEMTFSVPKKTDKILKDLYPGDRVSVQFSESDGKFTAESIKKS